MVGIGWRTNEQVPLDLLFNYGVEARQQPLSDPHKVEIEFVAARTTNERGKVTLRAAGKDSRREVEILQLHTSGQPTATGNIL